MSGYCELKNGCCEVCGNCWELSDNAVVICKDRPNHPRKLGQTKAIDKQTYQTICGSCPHFYRAGKTCRKLKDPKRPDCPLCSKALLRKAWRTGVCPEGKFKTS